MWSWFKHNTVLVIAFLLVLSASCISDVPFIVVVYSTSGHPVAGAQISGGVDWDAFGDQTNSQGIAVLPQRAVGQRATIFKTNFYPCEIDDLKPELYVIKPTPRTLRKIDEINGDDIQIIRFLSNMIATVSYLGNYCIYEYDDSGLTLLASAQLPGCIRFFKVYGDTLWLSTHEQGFYVYSIEDLKRPQLICHLNIPGCNIRPFAVKDTILAVATSEGPLCLFSFSYDGSFEELVNLGGYWTKDVTFIQDYLIVVGADTSNRKGIPVIFDVQDPRNPRRVYTGSQSEFPSCSMYKNYLVFQAYGYPSGQTDYRLLDLSNPASPQERGTHTSEAHIVHVIDDGTAFGACPGSILNGNIVSDFKIAATISAGYANGTGYPPYFIVGQTLWKIED